MAVTLPQQAVAYEVSVGTASGSRAWRRFALNPAALAGMLILLVVVGAALAAPWVVPHDPAKQSLLRRFTPPVWQTGGNAAYPLGTDQVGRDVLSRIVHGARISLLVGVSAVIVSLLVGVTAGLVSGFVGGKVDTAIGTVVDVTLSFPQILLTRVVRAEVMALREKEFIEAARAIGVGRLRIIFRHVLPNTVSSIVVMSTLQVAQAILAEAALSFLGVGSGRAYPTWGQMISLGRDFVTVAWWLPTLPGLAILVTVLAINLVGDRLRDALDPRTT